MDQWLKRCSLSKQSNTTAVSTFAEILVKLCVAEMATCVLGEHSKKKLETAQLHNNAVKCHIQDLSAGMEKQLVS
jgi:hypothetical protein